MSNADVMLIFGIIGFIIVLPIIAVGGLFFVKKRQKAGSQAIIKMDGATCVQTLDGHVEIRPTRITNIIALVFLAAVLIGGIAMIIASLQTDNGINLRGLIISSAFSLFIGWVIYSLVKALRRPGAYFKADTKVLELGRGSSQRVIPFDDIAQVLVGTAEGRTRKHLAGGVIALRLKTNEPIQLGTLSGAKDTFNRAQTIAQIIADVTGTSVQSQHRPRE